MFNKKELEKIGLSEQQIEIYSILILKTEAKASEILKESSFSKQTVYTTLQELVDLELVLKNEPEGKVATFKALNPEKLNDFVKNKKKELKEIENNVPLIIEEMVKEYNLSSGRPGVQVFEGEEGVRKVLEDTLKNKDEEILTYVDSETVEKEVLNIDKEYVQTRLNKKIKKRILMVRNETAEEYIKSAQNEFTKIKLLDRDEKSFYAVMQIYNNKVAYITYKKGILTSTIISDPLVYDLHKFIFNNLWEKTA